MRKKKSHDESSLAIQVQATFQNCIHKETPIKARLPLAREPPQCRYITVIFTRVFFQLLKLLAIVMPFGIRDLDQHWTRYCLDAYSATNQYFTQWCLIVHWSPTTYSNDVLKLDILPFLFTKMQRMFGITVYKMTASFLRPQGVVELFNQQPHSSRIFLFLQI